MDEDYLIDRFVAQTWYNIVLNSRRICELLSQMIIAAKEVRCRQITAFWL